MENRESLPDITEGRENLYESLGSTAWSVAYKRSLAEIKYAEEIYLEIQPSIKQASDKDKEYFEKAKTSKNIGQLEARFKLINQILEDYQPDKILEIAAGLSPRGLAMAEQDPNLQYVEIDLPEMIKAKREIIESLKDKYDIEAENLQVLTGDALAIKTLLAAAEQMKPGKFAIVNEGLLRYLSFEQKQQVAKNIHQLLQTFGGIWITPDITLRKTILSATKGAEYQRIKDLSGIDINENSFEDEQQAKKFFEDLGFEVEAHSYNELKDEVISPTKTSMTQKEVEETMTTMPPLFVMKLKSPH